MRVSCVREKSVVIFSDLSIGDAYYDLCGDLCIKTSNAEDIDNCIVLDGDEWKACLEDVSSPVTPLEAELIIHN